MLTSKNQSGPGQPSDPLQNLIQRASDRKELEGMEYKRGEAKGWAREHMRGACNVLLPTFKHDLKGLNEKAIRHDVRRNMALGFSGALLVSECGTTLEEMRQFIEIATDEARGRQLLILHGSFDTIEDTIAMAEFAEGSGIKALMLGYPPTFRPESEEEIYGYTRAVCDKTRLGVILFGVHVWEFGRFHPSGFSPSLLARLAEIETVVAIKYEVGFPGVAGMVEVQKLCRHKVLISGPMEFNWPAWVEFYGMQWAGTSNYEYYGDACPRYLGLLQEGEWEAGMEIYWRIHPARMANFEANQSWRGANFVHRMQWKYQGWLNGYNGGPLRLPVMRVDSQTMRRLRQGLLASGIPCTDDPDAAFFVGRNPG
jgi:4-hydroxy-tetrahydrodipicolinate synthase